VGCQILCSHLRMSEIIDPAGHLFAGLPADIARLIMEHCFDVKFRNGADKPKYLKSDPDTSPCRNIDERYAHAHRCRGISRTFFIYGSGLWLGPEIAGSNLGHLRLLMSTQAYIRAVTKMLIAIVKSDAGRPSMAVYSELFHTARVLASTTPPGQERALCCWETFTYAAPSMILEADLTSEQEEQLLTMIGNIYAPLRAGVRPDSWRIWDFLKLKDRYERVPSVSEFVRNGLAQLRRL